MGDIDKCKYLRFDICPSRREVCPWTWENGKLCSWLGVDEGYLSEKGSNANVDVRRYQVGSNDRQLILVSVPFR